MKIKFNLPEKKIRIKDLPDEVNDFFLKNTIYFVGYVIGITSLFLATPSINILTFALITILLFAAFLYFVYYQFTRDIIMVAEGTIEKIEKRKRIKKLYVKSSDLIFIINVPTFKYLNSNDKLRIYFNERAVVPKDEHIVCLYSYIILKIINYNFQATSNQKK